MTSAKNLDQIFLIGIIVMVLFGLLMVYNASMIAAIQNGSSLGYFSRQASYALVGLLLMVLFARIDYHKWLQKRMILLIAAVCIIGLILVYTQPPIKGARRGLSFGPASFQPSEMAKLVTLFYLASFLEKNHHTLKHPGRNILPCIIFTGLFTGLIVFEPDLGQAICIVSITAILFFIAGLPRNCFGIAFAAAVPTLYFFIWKVEFRRERLLAWLAALVDPLTANHHIRLSAIAVGHGGLTGAGLSDSIGKLLFLPEASTDFIYAIIAEEFGFVGAALVLAAFLACLYWGIKISLKAPDPGGFYLGLGISFLLALEAFINISSTLAIIPTKGSTLPLISRGGSSLAASLMASGILLNISSQQKPKDE
jgi:cell division protein FtsW